MQITIYMGSMCNLECAYCHKKADLNEREISESFLMRLKKLDDLTIKFMGGEPTLYMEDIKRVVKAVPKAKFIICTNGVNIEQYLEFFREHDFLVCISYDGDNNIKRGFDPLTKVIDYPRIAISTTIYHGHTDFNKIIKNFAEKERIIGRALSFFPHFAHATKQENDEYALSVDDVDYIFKQYQEMVGSYMEQRFKYGVRNLRYEGMFTGLFNRYKSNFEYGETYCVNKRLMKVNTQGESFSCLYMRDDVLSKNWQAEQQLILDKEYPECKQCPSYFMCGGGCIKSKSRTNECRLNQKLFSWFKAAYEKWREAGYAD